MNLDKLYVSLGLKTDFRALTTFNKGIKRAGAGIVAVGAASVATGYAMKRFIDSSKSSFVSLQNFTDQTGLAVTQLNKLKNAGKSLSLGLDEDTITSGVLSLEKTLARLRLGQGNFAPFQMLGLDVLGTNAFEVIEQLRERVKGLDDITATVLIEDIGLDANFLRILRLSREEFDKLGKNSFLNNKEAAVLNKLNLNLRKMATEFTNLKNKALVKLAPVFSKLIDDGFKWITQNSDKIIGTIEKIAKGLISVVSGFSSFINFISQSKGGLMALGVVAGGLALAFAPITTAIAGLLFLLQDIQKWRADGDAMFGSIYEAISKIPNLEEVLKIGAVITGLGLIGKMLKNFIPIMGGAGSKKNNLTSIMGGAGSKTNNLVSGLTKAGAVAGGTALTAAGGTQEEDGLLNKVLTRSGQALAAGGLFAKTPLSALGFAAFGGLAGFIEYAWGKFMQGDNSSTNNNNDINITINAPAGDAEAISASVKNVFQDDLIQSQGNILYQR
jgi:hypothetical protein